MIIRKMPSRFLIPGGEDMLVEFERSRHVSFNVGMGMSHVPHAARCNASLHCLAARDTRPNTVGG